MYIFIQTDTIKLLTYPNIVSNRYTISHNGDIFDTKKKRFVTKEISKKGYVFVRLKHTSGKRQQVFIHRLVAHEFIPNIYNKPTVNHKDGNKQNNYYQNLEWATHDEQMKHAYKTGLFNNKSKTKVGENGCNSKYPNSLIMDIGLLYYKNNMKVCEISKIIINKYPEYNFRYKKINQYIYVILRQNKFLKQHMEKFNDYPNGDKISQ